MSTKICIECDEEKPADADHFAKRSPSVLRGTCLMCMALRINAKNAEYRKRIVDVVQHADGYYELPLSLGHVAKIDPCDFYWAKQLIWTASAHPSNPYAGTGSIDRLHRLIAAIIWGDITGKEVDHINADQLDNRRSNLRLATATQNKWNKHNSKNQRLGRFKGVRVDNRYASRRWRAHIGVNSKQVALGTFNHAEEAALAYDAAAREHFGKFAACNFPYEG